MLSVAPFTFYPLFASASWLGPLRGHESSIQDVTAYHVLSTESLLGIPVQAFADTVFGGKPTVVDYKNVPSAVFSHPPIAAVGMTESEARNQLGNIKVFQSDFRPMKNVVAGRNERSLYKMIVDAANDRIVGIHMIGPEAPEIMQAAAIAVKAGLTKADFDATVAIHPTMAEELVLFK